MTPLGRKVGLGTPAPELALAAIVLASVVYVLWHILDKGFIPQPYFYVASDTFMDWHNPAYWAHRSGAYDVWHAVYPPLSFIFLRVFSIGSCYASDPFAGRACDWWGRVSLFGFYLLNGYLVFKCYRMVDGGTALVRAAMMTVGMPMLWALERGNLIIPCFTFFVLGHGRILRSAQLRWLAHAMAINFKPYLVLMLIPQAIRQRWRWLEGCGLASVLIYLVTFAIQGGGTPFEIAENTRYLADATRNNNWTDFFNATSYSPLVRFLNSPFPVMYYIGSRTVEYLTLFLPALLNLGKLGILACYAAACLQPAAARTHRLAALAVSFILSVSEPSGYTEVFLLFFVFFEKWQGPVRIAILTSAYLLCVSVDHIVFPFFQATTESWLTQRQVFQIYGIAVGQFIRPGLLMIIQYGLIALTFADLARGAPPKLFGQPGAPQPPLAGGAG